jgi:hypothetical protein
VRSEDGGVEAWNLSEGDARGSGVPVIVNGGEMKGVRATLRVDHVEGMGEGNGPSIVIE